MRSTLARLGYEYDENFLRNLIPRLHGAHQHRLDVGNAIQDRVTRSTALFVLKELDPAIGAGLQQAGVDWEKYGRIVALVDPISSIAVDDVELHEDFERALERFRRSHPNARAATPGNLALAIIEAAAEESDAVVGKRLREAGGNLDLLPQTLAEALEPARAEGEGVRPTVWLLHYKDEDRPARLFASDNPGAGIDWRSTKIIDDIRPGDPVIYWRDINRKKDDRGGLVGTGRFLGGLSRSEPVGAGEQGKAWHYYPTKFVELFADRLLERDAVITATDLNLNWRAGSILKVPLDTAVRIDEYLVKNGRKTLFIGQPREDVQDIVFISDAPKTDEDFLRRGDIAFVLAARLNRIWDETNEEPAGSPRADPESWLERRIAALTRSQTWAGLFSRRERTTFDSGFVVHIDAPWGGGKTTFANYLARILNPYCTPGSPPDWLANLPLHDTRFWPERFRRPWHVVTFNAWQHQHVDPPWWCFYQSIRRQCFDAVRIETSAVIPASPRNGPNSGKQSDAKIPPSPTAEFSYHTRFSRHVHWIYLWLWELLWRIFNPKVQSLLVTFLLTLVAAVVLYSYDLFVPGAFNKALSEGLKATEVPAIVTTGVLILFGGATAIWSVFAILTETLLPGTPDAARNYSLGSGDPLERFRRHFHRIVRSVNRPILVIVDDIDRCEPRFVVELLRGIHTILRSPRMVFVLLGHRDWIEHAFAHVHSAMYGIDVGPEHTFGGRFVEKAIQLSLVLPDITPDGRTDYVRQLLGVAEGAPQEGTETLTDDEKKEIEAILSTADPVSRDAQAKSLREAIRTNETLGDPARKAVVKQIDRQLALRSASDRRIQVATQHRLIPIAPVLPANPRQIKRIINGIGFFQEIARIEKEIQPESAEWCKLALWVVIMTEWPRTWATLSAYPGLADKVQMPGAATAAALPDEQQTKEWVDAIRKNEAIMGLLNFSASEGRWAQAHIDAATVEQFRAFMPAAGTQFLPAETERHSGRFRSGLESGHV
jgi:KAP family P-loop domain